ncbi:flavin monoamine oxidase family protein [Polymorphobacter sp.]|uniref:flavin monoamine oxidase family protein n=1 Tax=Polymorphobacter sp. TaxID=1909290 RepID=UPI003F711480
MTSLLSRRHLLAGAALLAAPALARTSARRHDFDLIVIGAGLSGLTAALTAQQQGARVLVVEARARIGGRIYTLDDLPGRPEAGANTFSDGYGAALSAAATAGVTMTDITPQLRRSPPQSLVINGQPIARDAWPTHPDNPFPDAFRNYTPIEAGVMAIADHPIVSDPERWIDPTDPAPDASVADWLAAKGFTPAAIQLAWDTSPAYGNSAATASARHIAFIQGWLARQRAMGTAQYAVAGGNQRLPEGLAAKLAEPVRLNTAVRAVRQTASGASLTTASGQTLTADRIIVSAPLPALRHIAFDPPLSPAKAEAVTRLGYQAISIIFLQSRTPFWREDGLSPGMWTNSNAGWVLASPFGEDPAQPINGFAVHGRGALATRWKAMGPAAAMASTIAAIEGLRPAAKGQLTALHYQAWLDDPLAGGAWAIHAPGQPRRLGPHLATPEGRLFFAGEHTSTDQRGMEAAASSGVMAALAAVE